ncbi:MAG: hypothetical protein FH758_00085 [Firmicutes bacterium]|nr:hypothetical protein [Bacillota bacterium]
MYYILLFLLLLIVSTLEIIPLYKKKQIKEIGVYITFIIISMFIGILLIAEADIPSIALMIKQGLSLLMGGKAFE